MEKFIKDWLEQHYTKDMSGEDIIVGLMDALLSTSKLDDTAYPNLREKILKAVAENLVNNRNNA